MHRATDFSFTSFSTGTTYTRGRKTVNRGDIPSLGFGVPFSKQLGPREPFFLKNFKPKVTSPAPDAPIGSRCSHLDP